MHTSVPVGGGGIEQFSAFSEGRSTRPGPGQREAFSDQRAGRHRAVADGARHAAHLVPVVAVRSRSLPFFSNATDSATRQEPLGADLAGAD